VIFNDFNTGGALSSAIQNGSSSAVKAMIYSIFLPWKWFGLWQTDSVCCNDKLIAQVGQLNVTVDLKPLGGYRGPVGTVTVSHQIDPLFIDWDEKTLIDLAKLQRKILRIQEEAQISNTLIFGRQERSFYLSFIPYPKCHWIEKIQGLIHGIFGSPTLTEQEATTIAKFYQSKFQKEEEEIPFSDGKRRSGRSDAFCRLAVIEAQKIAEIEFDRERYYLLHDKQPKGASINDPHLLILPAGDSGHCDGSQVSQDRRLHMLKIAQQVMRFLRATGYPTLLFLERNGEKLQSVQHKHINILGIQKFPKDFVDKVWVLMRLTFPFASTYSALKGRIQEYQQSFAMEKRDQ